MPTYNGISQADIAASINAAHALLLAHSTGPALEDHIGMVSDHALRAIATAQDDATLVQAIENSYVQANLSWISTLLEHHAQADTDGIGAAVYASLQAWGALGVTRSLVLSAVDIEIEKFIGRATPRNDLVPPGADTAAAPVARACKTAFIAPPRR